MYKNLAVLVIFLAILSYPRATSGQANMASAPSGEAVLDGSAANNSNKTEDKRDVSLQATAEARRLYKEAVKYGRGGLFKQATELFERAVELNPNYAEAHCALGQAYFDQGRWDDSIRSFENGIKIKPKDKNARARLDEAYARAGKNTKPDQDAQESITSTKPVSTNAWSESRARNVTTASVSASSVTPVNLSETSAPPSASLNPAPSVSPTPTPTSEAQTNKPSSVSAVTKTPSSVSSSTKTAPSVSPTATPTSEEPANKPESVSATKTATSVPTTTTAVTKTPSSVSTNTPPSVSPSISVTPAAASNPTPTAGIDLTRVYHIGNGDVLDVRLGHEPASQSTLFTVTPSGQLEHPILPAPLRVSGLTVEEATTRLEADLKRRSVNENPRVLIGVREYLSHAIIVSGLVKDPGTKLLRREAIPLYVVIADAQPAPEAGRATLIRHETGETVVADLSKPMEMNLLVRSGDVITVQENPKQFFYVGGEVKAPGEKQFRSGVTLTQAIITAGGLSRECSKVDIARASDKGFLASTRYKLKEINSGKLADPLIEPGDRITVVH